MEKILVIGFGSIGKRHFNVLKEILPNSSIDVVSKQRLEGINCFRSLYEIKDLNIYDYFVIASETYKHFEQLKYIDEKVKNKVILVEKPLFDIYIPYTSLNNNRIVVAYNLRYHPIVLALREISLQEKIIYMNVIVGQYLPTWRPNRDYRKTYSAIKEKGGGVLLDLSHEIDYVQWIAGVIENLCAINGKISNLEINSDDVAVITGTTKKGTVVNISLDYISKIPIRNVVLHTNKETFIGDFINNILLKYVDNNIIEESFNIDRNYTYKRLHQDIISGSFRYVCSLNEGLEVMKTISNIRRKSIHGKNS